MYLISKKNTILPTKIYQIKKLNYIFNINNIIIKTNIRRDHLM